MPFAERRAAVHRVADAAVGVGADVLDDREPEGGIARELGGDVPRAQGDLGRQAAVGVEERVRLEARLGAELARRHPAGERGGDDEAHVLDGGGRHLREGAA